MKKLSIKIFLVGLALLVVNQSCTNLEEELFSDIAADNFFKTDDEFIAALGAAYTALQSIGGHNNFFSIQEVATDEAMIPQRGGDWFDGGVWLRVHRHEFDAKDDHTNNAWNTLFGGVNTSNRLIFQFQQLVDNGQVAQADADPFIAELKALRALWYFWILDIWGNVPIVDRFDVPDGFAPPTQSSSEVYAFIESELLENVPKLSKAVDVSTYGRMNYYAGQALLAKLYLNAERYKGSAEWSKALTVVNDIINSGNYNLEGEYFTNFNFDNSASAENIFVVPYDPVFAKGFNLVQMTLHYQSKTTFNLVEQPWNGYCSLQEFYESYDDADRRKGVWGNQKIRGNFLAGPQYGPDGKTPIEDASADDPDGPPVVFTPEINEHFPNAQRQAGVRISKYEFPSGSTRDLGTDFPIFRYADILLMKAELLWRMNSADGEALALVNQVRERAGLEGFDALTPEDLLAERGREMFYEGWRRGDLIRFGVYGDEWGFKPVSDANKEYFPIPEPALLSNPKLVQNPGY